MSKQHPHIEFLIQQLNLEEKAQQMRYTAQDSTGIKALKRDGLALHPIKITRKSYGFAEYPEVSFRLNFPQETTHFKDGSSIELFCDQEESIKGQLLFTDGKQGEFRLFSSDFPDWLEDGAVGIKLAPDVRSNDIMRDVLKRLNDTDETPASPFFDAFHSNNSSKLPSPDALPFQLNPALNASQQRAVEQVLSCEPVTIIHGPPGTGKTTTLVDAIHQLTHAKKRVLVTAPSNTAVDHLALQLTKLGINLIRVGNQTRIQDALLPFTIEGKMVNSNEQKQIKKMRIQAEEYRKMANQYKRNFGKEEREQRKRIVNEIKSIRTEIRKLNAFFTEKWLLQAEVICGTPIALYEAPLKGQQFDALVIDEAGQCLEPMAWAAFRSVERLVLAGDHWQLPPTVISDEAVKNGFNRSFLEVALHSGIETQLLNTQYRMRESIVGFSNGYFYENKLQTPENLYDISEHMAFYDTAGTGAHEELDANHGSVSNSGELDLIEKWLALNPIELENCALISTYAGQVAQAKERFPKNLRISTIDSFQGQECDTIILSLVRSNEDQTIGFLKDYRRLNVALTRAKNRLLIFGDSITLGNDPFFNQFLDYLEKNGFYKSAWELM